MSLRPITCLLMLTTTAWGADIPTPSVEGQPLGANVRRVIEALEFLGAPLPADVVAALQGAAADRNAAALQAALDPHVLLVVSINPEARVKVQRGPAPAKLQQAGYTPVLIKVLNDAGVTPTLDITSPQAGAAYHGTAALSMQRQEQLELLRAQKEGELRERFLLLEMFREPPMTAQLSGLQVEYAVALVFSSESGRREATIGFDLGQQNQDLGFRGEAPVLFDIRPARPVSLRILDHDGQPTTARLTIRDAAGRVYPPQPRRQAPDFFFQPHIYRNDREIVVLPPGRFLVESRRGPEYRVQRQPRDVPEQGEVTWEIPLERWIDPSRYGFYSGDHHIHAAGCAHYTKPTEGVAPEDMFRQVKGEGLNVGCVLTWGPCFDYQRRFFSATIDRISEPRTLLKYDLEISGFGSQALGHVCLLNLTDQEYPGSDGTATQGWPTWTVPVMKWAKQQGGVTGYAHSASGLAIHPKNEAKRLLATRDHDGDGVLTESEASSGLLPLPVAEIDSERDGRLSEAELRAALERAADQLPNLAIPEMNGVGAMEVCVTTAEGVCDFISAMDTERIQEWNTWYHVMNCGFPLKVSGETDFPCMSSLQVGQGRVYVQLGQPDRLDFGDWCLGLAAGRSYVSDGYAHAVQFAVNGKPPGTEPVMLAAAGPVDITAAVAFAPETPRGVAHGTQSGPAGPRVAGDTRILHVPRSWDWELGGERRVEVVVNGRVAAAETVPADGGVHRLTFRLPVESSSWVALRQFPQLHTNPVEVHVGGHPIRASRTSALWCAEMIEVLWRNRESRISPPERAEARGTYQRAIQRYRAIAAECPEGT
uniref:EF-hand domain-containing protein n=1 Tax=Schlesneria paludicola TaxID=360056 RepID=A0A7C2PAC0_9PLAN